MGVLHSGYKILYYIYILNILIMDIYVYLWIFMDIYVFELHFYRYVVLTLHMHSLVVLVTKSEIGDGLSDGQHFRWSAIVEKNTNNCHLATWKPTCNIMQPATLLFPTSQPLGKSFLQFHGNGSKGSFTRNHISRLKFPDFREPNPLHQSQGCCKYRS